jgi:hypothetical protein
MAKRPRFALRLRRLELCDDPAHTESEGAGRSPQPIAPTSARPPDASAPLEELLRALQVTGVLGISERTLRRYVAKGFLPAVKLDGPLWFRPSDVQEFVLRSLRKR